MALGWPSSILTGESPGGMGKEGRFEERQWAHIIEDWQQNYMLRPVTQIFDLILKSKEGPTKGMPPKNWSVYFPSVFVETDDEKAALRLTMAQVDAQYIQLGVLNPIEVRESRWGETDYSIETSLNEQVSNQLTASANAQFETQMLGYAAQTEAYQNPQQEGSAEGDVPNDTESPQSATTAGGNAATQTTQPQNARKTDSYEVYDSLNLRIKVNHDAGEGITIGHPVGPDGQRLDATGAAPLMVFGPHRSRSYKVYRARFDVGGESVEGPYVSAFASLKAAQKAVRLLYPRQDKVSLSPIPNGELETLQTAWGTY